MQNPLSIDPSLLLLMKKQEILDLLKEEREKFDKSDKILMAKLVQRLVELGVYKDTPHTIQRGKDGVENPILEAVEGYGVDWCEYSGPKACPHCNADLCDRINGPPYKLEIGIYYNDRTAYYKCPDCDKPWNRFPLGHAYHIPDLLDLPDLPES